MDDEGAKDASGHHHHEAIKLLINDETNEVLYGQPGRVFYEPADEDGDQPGTWSFTRQVESSARPRQVQPFYELYPGTFEVLPPRSERTLQFRHSQRAYIYRHHPQAFFGVDLLGEDGFSEHTEGTPSGSLITIGEITDATTVRTGLSCPAIASAVGQSAHMVRVAVTDELVTGTNRELSFQATSVLKKHSAAEGFWCREPTPISQLRFASHIQKSMTALWLFVQNAGSLTCLEPALQRLSIAPQTYDSRLPRKGPQQVAIRELFALTVTQIGGEPFSDFSLKFSNSEKPPLLAVLGSEGGWTVWQIGGRQGVRQAAYKVRLVARGNCGVELHQSLDDDAAGVSHHSQILWLTLGKNVEDEDSPKQAILHQSPDFLVISRPHGLHLANVSNATVRQYIHLIDRGTAENVLGVQYTDLDPTQVFILTTNRLLWVQLRTRRNARPSIVLSCPHWRGSMESGLQMAVSAVVDAQLPTTCVMLYSPQSLAVDSFWFWQSGHARFMHQSFGFSADSQQRDVSVQYLVFTCKAIPPTDVNADQEQGYAIRIAAIGPDLSIRTSVVTGGRAGHDASEVKELKNYVVSRYNPQRDLVHRFEESFVISDTWINDPVPTADRVPDTGVGGFPHPSITGPHRWLNLDWLANELTREALAKLDNDKGEDQSVVADAAHALRQYFDGELADGSSGGTSFFETAKKLNLRTSYGLASALQEYLEELRETAEDVRVHNLESGRGGEFDTAQKLLRLLKELWQHEDDEDLKTNKFAQLRQLTTEKVAAEAWLSSVGVITKRSGGQSIFNEAAQDVEDHVSPSQSMTTAMAPSASRESGRLGDGPLARLQAFSTTPLSAPAGLQSISRIVRSWPSQPGSDPWRYTWMHESERALEEKRQQAEEKGAARRRRKAEKRAALTLPSRRKAEASTSTQPLPHIFGLSQPVQGVGMTQSQTAFGYSIPGSSQVTGPDVPGESMSQVVPGRFAPRMQLPLRKKRKVGTPKKAGFK